MRQGDTGTFSIAEHGNDVHGMLRLRDPRVELILDHVHRAPTNKLAEPMTRDIQTARDAKCVGVHVRRVVRICGTK